MNLKPTRHLPPAKIKHVTRNGETAKRREDTNKFDHELILLLIAIDIFDDNFGGGKTQFL